MSNNYEQRLSKSHVTGQHRAYGSASVEPMLPSIFSSFKKGQQSTPSVFGSKLLPLLLFCTFFSVSSWGQGGFVNVGTATAYSSGCSQLTAAVQSQGGAIWYNRTIDLTYDFSIAGTLNFGTISGTFTGGDGIGFVLQKTGTSALGGLGGGLGYQGIGTSLNVGFDTYKDSYDPYKYAIALDKNGDQTHSVANKLVAPIQLPTLTNGANRPYIITWTASTKTFKVTLDGTLRINYTGDIVNTIFGGSSVVYWGFTAATGQANNNQTVCITNYTVTQPFPTALCKDVTVNADNTCQVVLNAADFDNGSSEPNNGALTYSVAPSAITGSGDYNVVLSVKNDVNETSTCSAVVHVIDNIAPTITCPTPLSKNTDLGTCGAVATFSAPTMTDNCSPNALSGFSLIGTIGTHSYYLSNATMLWAAAKTDAEARGGHLATITSAVENALLAASNPAWMGLNDLASSGNFVWVTGEPVTYLNWGPGEPNFLGNEHYGLLWTSGKWNNGNNNLPFKYVLEIDAALTLTQTAGLASGATFPTGVTTNTFTATDASGNASSCSFDVTITDNEAPVITCPPSIPCVEATSAAGAVVTFPTATATDNCSSTPQVNSTPASGTTFPVGTTTVTAVATDAEGNASLCSFTVQVCDNTPPSITCPANIPCVEATSPAGAVVTYPPATATDIVDGTVTTYSILPSGSTFSIGLNTVVATATDANRNVSSCSFTVQVCDNTPPVITCPNSISINTDAGACGAVTTFGAPTITDNTSATYTQTTGLPSTFMFSVGVTTNTFVATDAAGNTSTCAFTITVTENEKPVITCPTPLSKNTDSGTCGALTTFGSATATDNCSVTVAQTGGLANGTVFPVGVSTLTFTATDASGNTATCSSTVIVTDNEKPVVTCPSNIAVNNTAGTCGAMVNFTISATDNCAFTSNLVGSASGSTFPVGVTNNVFSATDASNNTATCSFSVTVTDNEKPTITAPAMITSCLGTGIVLGTPTTGDNCGVQTVTNNAPTTFPNGTTTVTWTVTDVNGNFATATQLVKVLPITGLTPSVSAVLCNGGNTGTVSIAVSGGTPAFTYAWSNGGNTANITGLISGTYTVSVTDANGCKANTSVVVSQPTVLVAASNAGTIACNGGTTTVTVAATGGTAPYTGVGIFTKGAGTWPFTVTDKNGCTATTSVTIGQPTAIVLSTPSVTNTLCNGGSDAKIVVSATGGTGTKTFTISPIVGTQSPAGTFNNLTAGTYTITAKDANNCTKTTTATVTQPLAIDPNKCYTVMNKKSGKLLDVFLNLPFPLTAIDQYAANGGNNQKWRFTATGGGFVKIVAQNSGLALSNLVPFNNATLYQGYYVGGGNNDWKLECLANGYFKITQKSSGKALDVFAASLLNSIGIVINDWNGSDNQQWQIVETTCPSHTYSLTAKDITDINGYAEVQRNVVGFTTNQGFKTDYLTAEKLNNKTGTFETMEIRNNTVLTDEMQYHTFYDNTPDEGENNYRVKQTEVNGEVKYSAIQKIVFNKGQDLGIYPNPASEEAFIDLKSVEGRAVSLVISDLSGKTIQQTEIPQATALPYRLDLGTLQTGLYLVKVQAKGKRVMMRKLQVTK
jgi:Bacterial lectin/HYR domain/Secretion system C-terminal sorting domain/Ricin-type beta-trefoil lectin domain-like/SprB repeat/Lectin C-type domain